MKNSARSNFIYNSIYQLTNIIVPLITLPFLSRVLAAEGLGKYAFGYSVSYYFYMFIRLGLHSYGNRTIAYVKDDKDKLAKTFFELFSMQFVLGIVISLVYFLYCLLLAPDKQLSLIFILVVLSGGIDLTWMLYGLEEFKITSVRDIATKLITAACIFIFVKRADDVWKYALIYSLGFFINQLIVLPVINKRVYFVRPELKEVLAHVKPNLILFLPTIAVSVYKTMDKIMLGAMTSDVELGYYHGAENIIKVPLALVTALGIVMLPRMSNMLSNNQEEKSIRLVFNKSIMFAMFISTSICIGIMTVSKEFVPLFFGEGFDKCITLFYIILPSCIFLAFANVIRTQYLLPRKKDKLYIISLFTGAVVNLFFNLLLIPRYASVGAAIGTLAAEIIVCVVQAACVYKEADIGKNIVNSIPFIISGIVMFAVFHNYTPPISNPIIALLVKIIISGALYLTFLGGFVIIKRTLVRKTQA